MQDGASRYAVFGHPIAHSLSPDIHRAFARQTGRGLTYDAIDVAPEAFAGAVRAFFADGGAGANVTLPHKRAAFALADEHSKAATRVGTANVLTALADGRLAAHNTDGAGMVRDLTERHQVDLRGHHALLLGAGGAAHGVAWALLDAGVSTLTIVNRTAEAADALADRLGERLARRHDVIVAAGRPVPDRSGIARTMTEAGQVADAAPQARRDRDPDVHRLEDLHLRGLLALFGEDERLQLFVDRELSPLKDHDRAEGARTDLLAALRALLNHPASKTDAAAGLHLSRAAFYDRLAKIEAVLGVDLDDPDVRVSLHVALVADDLFSARGD
jgi:shikimate 5-dehydrogenase